MSLLSSYLAGQFVPMLDEALHAYEPEMRTMLINEVKDLNSQITLWLESKLVVARVAK